MIVFATSDKGGTGRSVTSCNVAFRLSSKGNSVAYLDFDFGSPTSGALFEITGLEHGLPPREDAAPGVERARGMHSYLLGKVDTPERVNVREETNRQELRKLGGRGGQLVLYPGDKGGAEFDHRKNTDIVDRCADLLLTVDREFDICIVDLSAGRSAAMEIVLKATAGEAFRTRTARWLVFHRWTRQHIHAAQGLVYGANGLLDCGEWAGHDRQALLANIRFVRTAIPDLNKIYRDGSTALTAWLDRQDRQLSKLAGDLKIGASSVLGSILVEPVLQMREQLILDVDVDKEIANQSTVDAINQLADRLTDERSWRPLSNVRWGQ
ncbi:SCO2523 family variant P-loop protein [Nocardia arizonensis]|uniref:SCO2523 family variant P-loop protein n=1 Tax=Nocardia arizonensis TaxID=1141647 RepID=UPI0006CFF927|nr:SCO2523 family variant P-loop protein [Nocardia arizonensis]